MKLTVPPARLGRIIYFRHSELMLHIMWTSWVGGAQIWLGNSHSVNQGSGHQLLGSILLDSLPMLRRAVQLPLHRSLKVGWTGNQINCCWSHHWPCFHYSNLLFGWSKGLQGTSLMYFVHRSIGFLNDLFCHSPFRWAFVKDLQFMNLCRQLGYVSASYWPPVPLGWILGLLWDLQWDVFHPIL